MSQNVQRESLSLILNPALYPLHPTPPEPCDPEPCALHHAPYTLHDEGLTVIDLGITLRVRSPIVRSAFPRMVCFPSQLNPALYTLYHEPQTLTPKP